MSIGYLSSPASPGTYVRPGSLEDGEVHVASWWSVWHLAADEPAWHKSDRYRHEFPAQWTRCGRRFGYGRGPRGVIATTDDPGEEACGRCERRPAGDRRFRQRLEQTYQVTMAIAAAAGLQADPDDVRRLVTLEVLRRP
jgi:hypothetical protein